MREITPSEISNLKRLAAEHKLTACEIRDDDHHQVYLLDGENVAGGFFIASNGDVSNYAFPKWRKVVRTIATKRAHEESAMKQPRHQPKRVQK